MVLRSNNISVLAFAAYSTGDAPQCINTVLVWLLANLVFANFKRDPARQFWGFPPSTQLFMNLYLVCDAWTLPCLGFSKKNVPLPIHSTFRCPSEFGTDGKSIASRALPCASDWGNAKKRARTGTKTVPPPTWDKNRSGTDASIQYWIHIVQRVEGSRFTNVKDNIEWVVINHDLWRR